MSLSRGTSRAVVRARPGARPKVRSLAGLGPGGSVRPLDAPAAVDARAANPRGDRIPAHADHVLEQDPAAADQELLVVRVLDTADVPWQARFESVYIPL